MKPSELSQVLTVSMRPWGFMVVDPPLVAMWHRIFGEYTIEEFSAALDVVIQTNVGVPEIAKVAEVLRRIKKGDETTEGEAWCLLMGAVSSYGYYNQKEAFEYMQSEDPSVAEAAGLLGWSQICSWRNSDEVANRAHFWKVLVGQRKRIEERELLANVIETKQIGGQAKVLELVGKVANAKKVI